MKDIKTFNIGTAYYILENNKGSRLKLTLNYGKNTYKSKVLSDKGNIIRLQKQASVVANNLLGKKAQKNLAYKLVHYKLT